MPAPAKIHWVVCDDYAAGPYTAEQAESKRDRADAAAFRGACKLEHRVTTSGVRPVVASGLAQLRAEYQAAALAADPIGGRDELADARAELVAAIMAAPLGTPDGTGLIVAETGWSREAGDRANAAATKGTPAWIIALGAHERVTLTSDGRPVEPSKWCRCRPEPDAGTWVRYERWTSPGDKGGHGFACPVCRLLVQSG